MPNYGQYIRALEVSIDRLAQETRDRLAADLLASGHSDETITALTNCKAKLSFTLLPPRQP